MQHATLWGRREAAATHAPLDFDTEVSVLVIGGGITGLATARALQERGHDVAVLEMHRVGLGTTGHSTGHLDITTDTGMHEVMNAFGVDAGARMITVARRALERAERWSTEGGIDCDMRRVPAYLYTEDEDGDGQLDREAQAYTRAGAPIERRRALPLPFPTLGGVCFPDQIRFDPLDFSRGLARVIVQGGGRVFENTRVRRVHDDRDGVTVRAGDCTIAAKHVVIATHAPLFGFVTMQTRAHPYQSYVLAVRVRETIEDALYWDEMDPYHYTRVLGSDEPRVLLVGGADHRTGDESDTEARFSRLRAYVDARYTVEQVVGRWSHEYFEPADRLPYVGRLPGRHRTFIGTAFSGDGLTWGLVTAELLADEIEGRDNPLANVLTPSRIKALASASHLASAGANIARHMVGDHLAFADVDRLDEIPAGEGRLIRLGLRRLAVYRDERGSLHAMSPICTHAKCVVQWNGAASTWDCPCHGGRYDAYGRVIAAPPKRDLEREDLEGER
jgi:glycine/D-amino acid oxidase-like deaminating enzyme/nitrite reductase/ring-hydroxylating ferredoxin subunit